MAITDDVIDRAIDAAEANMDANAESVSAESESQGYSNENSEQNSNAEEDIALQEAITKKQESKESKESKEAKESPKRDSSGKFTKAVKEQKTDLNDQLANAKEPEAVQEIDEQAQAAEPPIELPAFWSAEEKAALAKAPRELQAIIAQKEAQRSEWANRLANESERGKAFLNRLNSDFESPEMVQRHRAELALNGVKDEVEELHRYRAWDRLFKSDAKTAIADLMIKNGLSPHNFLEDADAPQATNDPRVDQALNQVEELKQSLKQQQEAQQQAALAREIDAFKNGKDSFGQVRKPYAEMFSLGITQEVDRILKVQPEKSLPEALNEAYEKVMTQARSQFGINGKVVPAQKSPEQIAAEAQKAKAAASSVTGAPSSGSAKSRPRAKTIDEAIDRAEEALGLR